MIDGLSFNIDGTVSVDSATAIAGIGKVIGSIEDL